MNCKPGDLAIAVSGVAVKENIGRIFEVLSFVGVDTERGPGSDWWFVKTVGSPAPNHLGFYATHGYCRDACLRPVSGLPDTEDTDTEQPIKEVA